MTKERSMSEAKHTPLPWTPPDGDALMRWFDSMWESLSVTQIVSMPKYEYREVLRQSFMAGAESCCRELRERWERERGAAKP